MYFYEVNWNSTEFTTKFYSDFCQLLSLVLFYPWVGLLVLWVLDRAYLFIGVAGRRSILCRAFSSFSPPFLPPLLCTVNQCDRYLPSQGCGVSWLGPQVSPAIGAVSILELLPIVEAPNQQTNLHITTYLLIKSLIAGSKCKSGLSHISQ